jgi:hypothetical protein
VIISNRVYQINKRINKPIEFKGLKAQYIWYPGGGLVVLLILFAIIYIIDGNVFICLVLIISLSTVLFMYVYKLSRTYGEFGLMKKVAKKAVPKVIKNYFIIRLKNNCTMKNLFDILPLYSVEQDAILYKMGEVTFAFKVELSELFTLSNDEYEAFHHSIKYELAIFKRYFPR